MKRRLREMREGFRIIRSRESWRAFRRYWSGQEIAARIDEWTSRVRQNTGQPPDPDLERRIAARRESSEGTVGAP